MTGEDQKRFNEQIVKLPNKLRAKIRLFLMENDNLRLDLHEMCMTGELTDEQYKIASLLIVDIIKDWI